jgi:hypothetical protein
MKTPHVAMVRDDYQRVGSGPTSMLVHVFHMIPQQASVGGPYIILMYTLEVW